MNFYICFYCACCPEVYERKSDKMQCQDTYTCKEFGIGQFTLEKNWIPY